MPFDFGSLSKKEAFRTLVQPREIFNALPARAAKLEYLRASQGSVLEAWETRRTDRDLVIKVNTGGGKTVVGLLVLQSCMNEGIGPGLYVAPDRYLVDQVRSEAADLGIDTTDNPEDRTYLEGKAIAVVNINKLMNAKSVFGGPGSTRPSPTPIGSLVIDDVHAALATASDQFTLTFSHDSAIYKSAYQMFKDALGEQAPGSVVALEAGDAAVLPQIVPFWAWASNAGMVAQLLQGRINDPEVMWKWPLVRDHIHLCRAAFTARSMEIAPPCLPVAGIAGYREAKRRIYLTATLADDGVLVTTFDADARSVSRPITPESASDQGDRLILAPQDINKAISDDEVKAAAAHLAVSHNVVVLVPSNARAAYWGDVAHITARAESMAETVELLRRDRHVGLVVLVNKYDGIDLPDEACRVLVLDGLPEVYGLLEQRDAAVLGKGDTIFDRQMQRIEQGMGRGVRGANDYCVVLLLGARLTQRVATPALRSQFSPLTKAQLDLSDTVSEGLQGEPSMDQLVELIEQVLGRDRQWLEASRSAVAGVSYGAGAVSRAASAAREAFNLACAQQYAQAAATMSAAASNEQDRGMQGLLKEGLATYRYFTDQAAAQQVLASAIKDNPRILRPLKGYTYERVSAHADQARAVMEYVRGACNRLSDLILRVRGIRDDLVFDPERTNAFEAAMEELGLFLGFGSQRPEQLYGNGPDNLWAVGVGEFLVFECKSGSEAEEIHRRDIAQLLHSVAWFQQAYPSPAEGRPILIHPSLRVASDAVASPEIRVISPLQLDRLKEQVLRFAEALVALGDVTNVQEIAVRLEHFQLNARQFVVTHSRPAKPA